MSPDISWKSHEERRRRLSRLRPLLSPGSQAEIASGYVLAEALEAIVLSALTVPLAEIVQVPS